MTNQPVVAPDATTTTTTPTANTDDDDSSVDDPVLATMMMMRRHSHEKNNQKKNNKNDKTNQPSSLSYLPPTRDCTRLFASTVTWQCAYVSGCIPCAYKIGCFDVALDHTLKIPNQRPEACPRLAAAAQHPNKSSSSSLMSKVDALNQQHVANMCQNNNNNNKKKKNKKSSNNNNAQQQDHDDDDDDDVVVIPTAPPLVFGYRLGQRILTVGDGDLSFSLALARLFVAHHKHQQQQQQVSSSQEKEKQQEEQQQQQQEDSSTRPSTTTTTTTTTTTATTLVATSLETAETLARVYPHFSATRDELLQLAQEHQTWLTIQVHFGIDATRLTQYNQALMNVVKPLQPPQQQWWWDRIVWNFPCSCADDNHIAGQDGQNAQMTENLQLVQRFLEQADQLLHPTTGQIHMNHKTKPPFDQWRLQDLAQPHPSLLSQNEQHENGTTTTTTAATTTPVAVVVQQPSPSTKWTYWGRLCWDRALFVPYVPRKALHAKSFPTHDACTFVLARNPAPITTTTTTTTTTDKASTNQQSSSTTTTTPSTTATATARSQWGLDHLVLLEDTSKKKNKDSINSDTAGGASTGDHANGNPAAEEEEEEGGRRSGNGRGRKRKMHRHHQEEEEPTKEETSSHVVWLGDAKAEMLLPVTRDRLLQLRERLLEQREIRARQALLYQKTGKQPGQHHHRQQQESQQHQRKKKKRKTKR